MTIKPGNQIEALEMESNRERFGSWIVKVLGMKGADT